MAVVTDSTNWNGLIGNAVRDEVGTFIRTLPVPEPSFDLVNMQIRTDRDLDQIKRRKNVLFVSPIDEETNEAQMIRNSLSAEAREAIREGNTVVASRSNLWRRNQQVFFVTGDTEERIANALEDRGREIRDTLNVLARERMQRDMFERGRQPELEDSLMNRHDFAIHAQHDYVIAQDTTTEEGEGFIWLRRVLSDTWRSLFIYYREDSDPGQIEPDWIFEVRDSLAQQNIRGTVGGFPRTDYRRPIDIEERDFLGRYGYESRALWHMVELDEDGTTTPYGGGGPYVNYTFYDQESGRIYMLDGMVFAPDYDKRDFLRQMEVISHTFRTRHDVEEDEEPQTIAEE